MKQIARQYAYPGKSSTDDHGGCDYSRLTAINLCYSRAVPNLHTDSVSVFTQPNSGRSACGMRGFDSGGETELELPVQFSNDYFKASAKLNHLLLTS